MGLDMSGWLRICLDLFMPHRWSGVDASVVEKNFCLDMA